jgi:hypothetical protein
MLEPNVVFLIQKADKAFDNANSRKTPSYCHDWPFVCTQSVLTLDNH